MSEKLNLLMLPVEIRCHIYSYIYLENQVVPFLERKPHYTKTALFLSCKQLHRETLEYYYSSNTFSLPLSLPCEVSYWRFPPRHFHLVKALQLETSNFFWNCASNSAKTFDFRKKLQNRLRNYLEGIFWFNEGMVAPRLKTLIFADRVARDCEEWHLEQRTEASEKRLAGYMQVFEQLHIEVGQVVISIRKEIERDEDDCVGFLDF